MKVRLENRQRREMLGLPAMKASNTSLGQKQWRPTLEDIVKIADKLAMERKK